MEKNKISKHCYVCANTYLVPALHDWCEYSYACNCIHEKRTIIRHKIIDNRLVKNSKEVTGTVYPFKTYQSRFGAYDSQFLWYKDISKYYDLTYLVWRNALLKMGYWKQIAQPNPVKFIEQMIPDKDNHRKLFKEVLGETGKAGKASEYLKLAGIDHKPELQLEKDPF